MKKILLLALLTLAVAVPYVPRIGDAAATGWKRCKYKVTNVPPCTATADHKHVMVGKPVQDTVPIDGVPPSDCQDVNILETCGKCKSTYVTEVWRVGPKCADYPPPGDCKAK